MYLKESERIVGKKNALAGNRTRAARVAGEHSTTEPPVLHTQNQSILSFIEANRQVYFAFT
jgi:hypothetical protein